MASGCILRGLVVVLTLEAAGGAMPTIAPKVIPQLIRTPEFRASNEVESLNRPLPMPQKPQAQFPSDFDAVFDSFPADPPMRDPTASTDSSDNWPLRSSALKGPQPPPRWMHTAVMAGSKMVVWGGIASSAASLNDLWLYSEKDALWTELERPMAPSLPAYPNAGPEGQGERSSDGLSTQGRPAMIRAPPPMLRAPFEPQITMHTNQDFSVDDLKTVSPGTPPSVDPLQPSEMQFERSVAPPPLLNSASKFFRFLELGASMRTRVKTKLRHAVPLERRAQEGVLNARSSDPPAMETQNAARSDMWIYSVDLREWAQPLPVAEKPEPRWMHSAIVYNPGSSGTETFKMMVFGGCSNSYRLLSDVWEFDVTESTWTAKWPNMQQGGPTPREGHAAAVADGGGSGAKSKGGSSTGAKSKGGSSTSGSKRKLLMNKSPTSSSSSSSSKTSESMWVFGGITEAYMPLDEMWQFDFESSTWTKTEAQGPVPSPRWLHSMVPFKSSETKLIVFGGCGQQFGPLDDTWEFLPSTGIWRLLGAPDSYPPPARFLHVALPIVTGSRSSPQKMIIHGGAANNVMNDDMWAFDVRDEVWEEVYVTSDMPMARKGHSMVFAASPDMVTQIEATTELLGSSDQNGKSSGGKTASSASTGRKLLSAPDPDSQEWMSRPTDPKMTWEQFWPLNVDSDNNYWFLLFGGAAERGQATSASGGGSFLY